MAKFDVGHLVATVAVHDKMLEDVQFEQFVRESFNRYIQGDWGSTCEEDSEQNDYAVEHGERILAVYEQSDQPTIWIVTKWDRSATAILFPDEH